METEEIVSGGPALAPAHPGEVLREDVLPALGMSKAAFAAHLGISRNTLYKLLNEEQPVTLDLALRLGKALGDGPRVWLALQAQHDIWRAEQAGKVEVKPLNWKGAA
jgi:addiction module HigA family antidote